jgi:hypothetical protein
VRPEPERGELLDWCASRVRFPGSMVDRIVPRTTDRHREVVRTRIGLSDASPVPAEEFSMWVVEDDFATARPAWDRVGAIFSEDVHGYEVLKIRLLNGTHSLLAYLGMLVGAPTIAAAVQRAAVHRAVAATGFPFTRWLRRLRPDPLRRRHLDRARTAAVTGAPPTDDPGADLPRTTQRTSLPASGAVERSRVELALRHLADDAAVGLPDPWPDAVRDAARSRSSDLADALDRAISTTDLGVAVKPLWWRAVGGLQALLAVARVAGALWLTALYALTVLRLPEPEPPAVGLLPLPTALLIGGLLAGLLLALLARALAVVGARRRRKRAEARLREAVAQVADTLVLTPVRAELAVYAALRTAVATLRGTR